MRLRERVTSAATGAAVWLIPAVALASEQAEHGAAHHAVGPDKAFWFAVFNFVVFVGLLIKFTRQPIADFLAERHGALQKTIAEVKQQREELAQQQADLARALAEFESARAARVALATKAAQDEAEAIVREAREQANAMIEGARARAQGILQSGEDEAVRRFVNQLVQDAEAKIRSTDPATLDRGFVGRVSSSVQSGARS